MSISTLGNYIELYPCIIYNFSKLVNVVDFILLKRLRQGGFIKMEKVKKILKAKRILSLLLAICMTFSLLPITAFAGDENTTGSIELDGGKLDYEIDGDHVIITGGDESLQKIEIPAEIENLPVTTIKSWAFYSDDTTSHKNLTSVKFPSSLTTIEGSAFGLCKNLSKVDFSECTKLKLIGQEVFSGDSSITSVTLPKSLEDLGDNAFNGCGLVSLDLSNCDKLIHINNGTFCENKSLESVTLSNKIKIMDENAFYGCEKLKNVNFSECTSLHTIGNSAFCNTGLESIKLPASISNLGEAAFIQCKQLKNADLSSCNELTAINNEVFNEDESLSSVKLPSSITSIGNCAFRACALQNIDLSQLSLTEIGNSAFGSNSALKEVKLPKSLETIENEAFSACEVLSSVDLSICTSLKRIGELAFNSTAITSVTFPDSLETIDKNAFNKCESLNEVNWPTNSKLTTITGFSGCTALPVDVYNASVKLPGVTAIGEQAFEGCSFESVEIPSNIKEVGAEAFQNSPNLKSLTIKPGLKTIGDSAFSICALEGTLDIPGTVKRIGKYAFSGKISGLNIADGVETIEECAFNSCDGLAGKTVVLPESVTMIGCGAFGDCSTEENPITLEIKNKDINLQEAGYNNGIKLNDKWYYSPFTTYSSDYVIIRAYAKNSKGEASMMKLLYDALKDNSDGRVYEFYALDATTYTVSGKVPNDAKVELYINDSKQAILPEVKDGTFTASVNEGSKVTVTVSMSGYYDKHFINTEVASNWDLGTVTFEEKDKIPANNIMKVELKKEVNGETQDVAVSGFENLELTLNDGSTVLEEGTDYTLQYPYIILKDTVKADELTLTVKADNICYTGSSATSNRNDGVFTIKLTPWGKLNITTQSEYPGSNNILVFDNNGKLVGQSEINKNGLYITNSLKSGKYSVIAFNANDSFSAVSSIEAIKTMGLKKGTDYAEETFDVLDNNSKDVKITVPLLKTNVEDILNKQDCSVISEKDIVVAGQSQRLRIYYSFKDEKKGTLFVNMPNGANLDQIYSQNKLFVNGTDYTVNGNIITINPEDTKGFIYMTMSFSEAGEQNISASATVGKVTAPIGSASIKVQNIFLETNSKTITSLTGNTAVITAAPNSEVVLTLDGMEVARGTTNANGTLKLTYELPQDSVMGQSFSLKATCGDYSVDTSISCAVKVVNLETWSFYQGDKKTVIYNALDPNSDNSIYSVVPYAHSKWTVSATFIGKEAPQNVISYFKMLGRSIKSVDMTLVKTEEVNGSSSEDKRFIFAGELVRENGEIPQDFAIDWEDASEYFTYDTSTAGNIEKKAEDRIQKRSNDVDSLRKSIDKLGNDIDNSSDYIFGAKYRVSETKREWFKGLSEKGQAAVYNFEKAIDKAAKEYSQCLGLQKNITEYSSWDEVYSELGVTKSKNTKTIDELREDGFTVCENEGKFTAYKDTTEENNTEQQSRRSPLRKLKGILSRASGVGGVTGGFTFIDSDGNQIDYVGNANGNISQSLLNGQISDMSEAYDNFVKDIEFDDPKNPNIGLLNGLGVGFQVTQELISLNNIKQDSDAMVDFTDQAAQMQGYIDELRLYENRYAGNIPCSNAIMFERQTAQSIQLLLDNEAYRSGANAIAGAVLYTAGYIDKTQASDVVGAVWDKATNTVGARRAAEIQKLLDKLDHQTRTRSQKCDDTDMEDLMRKSRRVARKKALIDPSGIVYEAVKSNTLAGVKATVWCADDSNGTNAREWDAEAYDQVRTQITDESGEYKWDVPAGWWQVRFEKEGYESTQTEWMEVPPPRLGLETAMVSTKLPQVISANAYPDYIEVIFDQYMDISSPITLPSGMTGSWQSIEEGKYSKTLHITREEGFTKGSTVSFTLEGAKNYANKELASYNSGDLTVTARPAQIILNYENVMSVEVGTERKVTVRVKDLDGNYMEGINLKALIVNTEFASFNSDTAVTDSEGKAVFEMNTYLPGSINITFNVPGTNLSKTINMNITMEANRPKRPIAQIGNIVYDENANKENYITVKKGTQLTISAEDGVAIYYTTDDTCPCQNSASRNVYTGPITITENVKFRIAAYKDGMDYSDRLNITVVVEEDHQHDYGSEWKSNGENHWHECSCGAVIDKANHDFEIKNAKPATEDEDGYTGDKVCKICGYKVKGSVIKAGGSSDPTDPSDPINPPYDPVNPSEPINPPYDPTNPDSPRSPSDDNSNVNDANNHNGALDSKDNNNKDYSPSANTSNQVDADDVNSSCGSNYQTGDTTNLSIWVALLFVSGGILGSRIIIQLKKKKNSN